MRDYFDEHDFIDVETPILGRSTPEGARDYLVPSRVHHGTFYALPQSPQLYKQILMIAGYDRYVQVARCFRDEDLRADRQPEFTQLDLEMSFVDADDVIGMIDGLMQRAGQGRCSASTCKLPLPRMTYDEAMERFGHDAPDLRFGLELVDCTDLAPQSDFRVFTSVADERRPRARRSTPRAAASTTRASGIDELTEFVAATSARRGWPGSRSKPTASWTRRSPRISPTSCSAKFAERMQAEPGDLLLFVADTWEVTCKALYALRKKLGEELKLYDPQGDALLLDRRVPDVRLRRRGEALGGDAPSVHRAAAAGLGAARHRSRQVPGQGVRPGDQRLRSRRRHDPDPRLRRCSSRCSRCWASTTRRPQERFGFLLDALQYGAPPHGGIALGIDRWVMLFGGLDNIRDCIAFPKTQKATDLMTERPARSMRSSCASWASASIKSSVRSRRIEPLPICDTSIFTPVLGCW